MEILQNLKIELPYDLASLIAQLVKNPPAMLETWVQSLGWEDPLEKGKATQSSILAWRSPWGRKELDTTERLHFHFHVLIILQKNFLEHPYEWW